MSNVKVHDSACRCTRGEALKIEQCPVWHARTGLTFVSDAGHGYLRVPLDAFPCATQYGTGFGFLSSTDAWLEEDVEAPSFLKHHEETAFIERTDVTDYASCRRFQRIPDAGGE